MQKLSISPKTQAFQPSRALSRLPMLQAAQDAMSTPFQIMLRSGSKVSTLNKSSKPDHTDYSLQMPGEEFLGTCSEDFDQTLAVDKQV